MFSQTLSGLVTIAINKGMPSSVNIEDPKKVVQAMPCTSASHATAGTKRMDEIRAVMPAANRIASDHVRYFESGESIRTLFNEALLKLHTFCCVFQRKETKFCIPVTESAPFFWRSTLHQMRPPYCKTETATTTPIPDKSAGHWWRINCDSFEPTSRTCGAFLVSLCDSLDPPSLAVGTISGVPSVAGNSRARASKKSWDSGIHRRPAVAITPGTKATKKGTRHPHSSTWERGGWQLGQDGERVGWGNKQGKRDGQWMFLLSNGYFLWTLHLGISGIFWQ